MNTKTRDVTAAFQEAACFRCGQQDGPFLDVGHAKYVLEPLGWRRRPPVMAWQNGTWQPGYTRAWWCPNCFPLWDRARRDHQAVLEVDADE